MRRLLIALGALCLALPVAAPTWAAPTTARIKPPARPMPIAVVVRREGLRVYEQVAEEFRGNVRAAVRVVGVPTSKKSRARLRQWLRESRPNLLFAIGQSAYDMVRRTKLASPLVHAMVFHRMHTGHHSVSPRVPAQGALSAFRTARPAIKRIAVLHGNATADVFNDARAAAAQLGLTLVPLYAKSAPHAIRLLHRMPKNVGGLWLLPDLAVLLPQVFQYAVGIQLRRRLPLMGATRHHVRSGALFALDYEPTALGRQASIVATRLLRKQRRRRRWRRRRRRRRDADADAVSTKPRLSVNAATAERIGVPLRSLRSIASEVLQ